MATPKNPPSPKVDPHAGAPFPKPAAKKPASKKPASKKPAAKKSAAKKPASKKPAFRKGTVGWLIAQLSKHDQSLPILLSRSDGMDPFLLRLTGVAAGYSDNGDFIEAGTDFEDRAWENHMKPEEYAASFSLKPVVSIGFAD